jgi:hypothetical protein
MDMPVCTRWFTHVMQQAISTTSPHSLPRLLCAVHMNLGTFHATPVCTVDMARLACSGGRLLPTAPLCPRLLYSCCNSFAQNSHALVPDIPTDCTHGILPGRTTTTAQYPYKRGSCDAMACMASMMMVMMMTSQGSANCYSNKT